MNADQLRTAFPDPIKVGHDGHVMFMDAMGDDAAIVQAARASYQPAIGEEYSDTAVRRLIRYLMRNRHTSPFEMPELKLHLRMPIYVARQWVRHRKGDTSEDQVNMNEYSGRYGALIDSIEPTTLWRAQATNNKQGSYGFIDPQAATDLSEAEGHLIASLGAFYRTALDLGVAKEQARKHMPVSNYTSMVWKMDLHNLLHFLGLRLDHHAQREMRDFANAVAEIVKKWVPHTWEAFDDFRFHAVTWSKLEWAMLYLMNNPDLTPHEPLRFAKECGWLTAKNSERTEFEEKLERIGMRPVWSAGDFTP